MQSAEPLEQFIWYFFYWIQARALSTPVKDKGTNSCLVNLNDLTQDANLVDVGGISVTRGIFYHQGT